MDGWKFAGNVAIVLVVSADMMMIFSLLRMLPWRTTGAFMSVASFVGLTVSAAAAFWTLAGLLATNMTISGYVWWKHRNDDDDDDATRRRRRVKSKMGSRLPRPRAFIRPVPANS